MILLYSSHVQSRLMLFVSAPNHPPLAMLEVHDLRTNPSIHAITFDSENKGEEDDDALDQLESARAAPEVMVNCGQSIVDRC